MGVEERMLLQTTATTKIKHETRNIKQHQTMGRVLLQSGKKTEFDPSLFDPGLVLGRAGQWGNGFKVDTNYTEAVVFEYIRSEVHLAIPTDNGGKIIINGPRETARG